MLVCFISTNSIIHQNQEKSSKICEDLWLFLICMYTKVIINQTKCPNARTDQRKCFVSWIVQLRLSIDVRLLPPNRGKPRFWWNRGFVKYGKRMSARQIRSPGISGQCPMHAMVKRHHRTACEWAFYQCFAGRTIFHQNQVIGCSADIIGIGGLASPPNLPGMVGILHDVIPLLFTM